MPDDYGFDVYKLINGKWDLMPFTYQDSHVREASITYMNYLLNSSDLWNLSIYTQISDYAVPHIVAGDRLYVIRIQDDQSIRVISGGVIDAQYMSSVQNLGYSVNGCSDSSFAIIQNKLNIHFTNEKLLTIIDSLCSTTNTGDTTDIVIKSKLTNNPTIKSLRLFGESSNDALRYLAKKLNLLYFISRNRVFFIDNMQSLSQLSDVVNTHSRKTLDDGFAGIHWFYQSILPPPSSNGLDHILVHKILCTGYRDIDVGDLILIDEEGRNEELAVISVVKKFGEKTSSTEVRAIETKYNNDILRYATYYNINSMNTLVDKKNIFRRFPETLEVWDYQIKNSRQYIDSFYIDPDDTNTGGLSDLRTSRIEQKVNTKSKQIKDLPVSSIFAITRGGLKVPVYKGTKYITLPRGGDPNDDIIVLQTWNDNDQIPVTSDNEFAVIVPKENADKSASLTERSFIRLDTNGVAKILGKALIIDVRSQKMLLTDLSVTDNQIKLMGNKILLNDELGTKGVARKLDKIMIDDSGFLAWLNSVGTAAGPGPYPGGTPIGTITGGSSTVFAGD